MSRSKGTAPFSANFEPQKAAPLDARFITANKADLILSATWTAHDSGVYTYKGMFVNVHSDSTADNNGIYRLTDTDYTDINNWEKIGSGSGEFSTKVWYVFDDVAERDAFFVTNPTFLVEDVLIAIKDTTPPPTPGIRSYNFSKAYNSQYKLTAF